ncbi:type II toxin-antitoxin system mRNA interferase toxin, RelE/StbE family [Candidatus Roizmanbacteria bacterium]|nr:type II toxin-antitoxin system mRNA interferase toxin, RelE/StbE family [Candidatus Roizmanbacteria bacterium]
MKAKLDPELLKKLRKLDVRIRNRFKERILLFSKNPNDPKLNNHPLKREYQGLRSIDITNDYRAVYEEMTVGEDIVAYFSLLGRHKELYG